MEKASLGLSGEINFHKLHEERKELKKASAELEYEGEIFEEHYQKPLEQANAQAENFKISEYGGLKGAKEFLKKQKTEQAENNLSENSEIDYESILKDTPEIKNVKTYIEGLSKLRDFRMRRMFETLNKNTTFATKKRNDAVLETIRKKIRFGEEKLAEYDLSVLRQAKLIGYKEDLAKSGHICITPNVEKDLEAIGDRMLTGKPMFLHGPTGTGKTSLARFGATHFTGKDAEMVYCHPQTKESNVWGKTAIKAQEDDKGKLTGAIFTYLELGPLAKAIKEGKTVIFDEFTALPKEQMVFIKAVFGLKPGDLVNVVGDGMIKVAPGFQAVFTANLKSEKNPERQDLPPEIAREFEQNNLEIKYTEPAEAYDIILVRLLNSDGSLDMSFYDLNETLPNLCRAMSEIQESYTDETDKDVARRSGAMDASGKVYSLKKFVMTQGSIEAIISSWLIEKQIGKHEERSFAEFLDERFKTALTFKEYPKEDRILVAKILASRGFLLTLSAKDLDLPDDIFQLNAIKQMRGEDAIEELREKSGDVKHLTLREIAQLDPFGKRAEILKNQAESLLESEDGEADQFLKDSNDRMRKLFGKEKRKENLDLSVAYTHPDGKQEIISIPFEQKLQEYLDFYQKNNINIPQDFEQSIQEIWQNNQTEMEQAIQEKGFDEIIIIPGNIPLPEIAEEMKMEKGIWENNNFKEGGSFAGAISQNIDKHRIILVHKTQNLEDRPELQQTLNIKGEDVKQDEALTLEDYLIFQKKYFEETNKHLDEDGYTWLATKSGPRLVGSDWSPRNHELNVYANDLEYSFGDLGVRPARCFF